jgi:hypothetical protein
MAEDNPFAVPSVRSTIQCGEENVRNCKTLPQRRCFAINVGVELVPRIRLKAARSGHMLCSKHARDLIQYDD